MTEYERIINQAVVEVIKEYGYHADRPTIRKQVKEEFKKLSMRYRMQDVHSDAVRAFSAHLMGSLYYQTRKIFTSEECIERGRKKHAEIQAQKHSALAKKESMKKPEDELIAYLRSASTKKSYLDKRQVR